MLLTTVRDDSKHGFVIDVTSSVVVVFHAGQSLVECKEWRSVFSRRRCGVSHTSPPESRTDEDDYERRMNEREGERDSSLSNDAISSDRRGTMAFVSLLLAPA